MENHTCQNKIRHKAADILLPFLVYYIVHDVTQILFTWGFRVILNHAGEQLVQTAEAGAASVGGVIQALALMAGAACVLPMAMPEMKNMREKRQEEMQEVRHAAGKKAGSRMAAYGLLVICAAALAAGVNLLFAYTGLLRASVRYIQTAEAQYGISFGLGLVFYGVVSPLAEETVFRGIIYNRLRRDFEILPAVVICGILFGVYHGNLVQGIYGSLLGIVIALMYEWFGSMRAPLLFHSAANVSIFILSSRIPDFQKTADLTGTAVCLMTAFISFIGIAAVIRRR